MRQNHRVIFSGGDFGNIAVPVLGGEVLHRGHQQIGIGEKAVKLGRPLADKGIGDHKHRLVDRAQVLQVHPGRNQRGGFPGAHLMGRKPCAGVNDTGNKVKLVLPQLHLGVHAGDHQMAPIVFTGPDGVEGIVIQLEQGVPALRFPPYPGGKGFLNLLLFGAGDHGFLRVDDIADRFIAPVIGIFLSVTDGRGLHIQAVLQYLVGVFAACAERLIHRHGIGFKGFIADPPGGGIREILNINAAPVIPAVNHFDIAAGLEGFIHELAVILNRHPDGAQIHLNIGRGKRCRLYRFQRLHIPGEQLRLLRRPLPCVKQLIPHMAAQVFLRQFPALIRVPIVFLRIEIDAAAQLLCQFVRGFPGQEGHIGEIHPQLAVQADLQGVLGGISVVDLPEWPDGRLVEDGRFIPAALILSFVLNGAQQGELVVIGKGEDIALAVDGPIFGGETVIDLIELILRFAEVQRGILMGLDADDLQQRGTDFT